MERYLTTSEARQKFLTLVDEVSEGDQIVVTKRGVPKAAIVNFEHLETLKAVARLWQDPEALRAMQESIADLKKGRALKLSGLPRVRNILEAARKKGLLRG
jgi:prevent-host-death family protein